jgi:hypothetical protein
MNILIIYLNLIIWLLQPKLKLQKSFKQNVLIVVLVTFHAIILYGRFGF